MGNHDAKTWGRIGGLTAWSRNGRDTMLSPAVKGFAARFAREVDPAGVLPPEERALRAERARRAWMLKLGSQAAQVRAINKAASTGTSVDAAEEIVDADDEPRPSG